MKNTEYIGKVAINYDYYGGEDLYQDGSEDELYDIVKNHKPEEYNSIIEKRKEWALLYHLSDIRENIVDWITFTKEDKVLEIGAGCGAITGSLARHAGRVDCIELSKKRSLVNAKRHEAFDNINITVGNFQDIEKDIEEKYDYITLIGVLEYAASYIASDTPYEEFLKIIKKHLAPSGKIIIAIENKYGLKYWAGCREDHLGTYYSGIEGYVGVDSVRTFSKNGLSKLLEDSGYENIKFYYPYPDYKLPLSIYSDDFLPQAGSLNNNFRNFDEDRMLVFDESKVFDNLLSDGMFDIFSNSFLVIAGKGEKA
ncbi:MAG: class I SAM-dependent methyltransferase [Lachnospiraceae bacterium]|nr:class I SAM-dependent methyltransferase [Lachnospiraceae bacterium]